MDPTKTDEQLLVAKLDQQVASLNLNLKSLRELCRKECGGPSSECHGIHGWNIRNEYKKYYMDDSIPERWDHGRDQYKQELSAMFEDGARMQDIHLRVGTEKRRVLSEQVTTFQPADNELTRDFKITVGQMFEAEVPTEEIKTFVKQKNEDVKVGLSAEQLAVTDLLAKAGTEAEQYEIYRNYHGSLQPADQQDYEWKDRLRRMYTEGAPLSSILDFSQKYVDDRRARADANANEIQNLKEKIDENRMAWRAHKRRITAKDEKKSARAAEKRAAYIASNTYPCSSPGCQEEAKPSLDQESGEDLGPTECPVCYSMWYKRHGQRQFFSSLDCFKQNWLAHRNAFHPCAAGPDCEEKEFLVGDGDGTCDECDHEHNVFTYWCSNQCFDKTADEHTRQLHGSPRDGRSAGRPSDVASVEGDFEKMDVDSEPAGRMETDN